jgi:Leucine-rich repeat (LRR) protein
MGIDIHNCMIVKMKYFLLAIILLLTTCTNKEASRSENETQHGSNKTERLADSLILGGRPYVNSSGEVFKKDETNLIGTVYCNFSPDAVGGRWHSFEGMEQLVNLEFLAIDGEGEILETLDFSPLASLTILENVSFRNGVIRRCGFAWTKHLTNTKKLGIEDEGDALASVDFTPLASLTKLEEINFSGNITSLPDLTKLRNICSIGIGGYVAAALESLEGIGAPNAESIRIRNSKEIVSFVPLNNLMYLEELQLWINGEKVYKIAEMSNLPSLKELGLYMGNTKIDLQGIENISSLEVLYAGGCEPFNIEGIGKLANLRYLNINLISSEPSLEFLRGMPKLAGLDLEADSKREDYGYVAKAYQVLDLSPLATVKSLQQLSCIGFIIKNISALDVLNIQGYMYLVGSRFYDETEKSKHTFYFEIGE